MPFGRGSTAPPCGTSTGPPRAAVARAEVNIPHDPSPEMGPGVMTGGAIDTALEAAGRVVAAGVDPHAATASKAIRNTPNDAIWWTDGRWLTALYLGEGQARAMRGHRSGRCRQSTL